MQSFLHSAGALFSMETFAAVSSKSTSLWWRGTSRCWGQAEMSPALKSGTEVS